MLIDCEALSHALMRLVAIDSGLRSTLAIDGGKLTLTLVNHEVGEVEEDIEVEWNGEPLKLMMRAKSLLSILDALDCDQCSFKFKDGSTAPVIHPWRGGVADLGRTYLTMPVGFK